MADATSETPEGLAAGVEALGSLEIPVIKLLNKVDQISYLSVFKSAIPDLIPISAKNRDGLHDLETALLNAVGLDQVSTNGTLVTNLRHYQQLLQTQETLEGVLNAMLTSTSILMTRTISILIESLI